MTMGVHRVTEMWIDRFSDFRAAGLSFSILIVLTWLIFRQNHRAKDVPEPPALPIIGHLHLMGKLPHQILMKLARQYGPLMSIRLGSLRFIVASNAEMAKELLKSQDAVWASRPHTLFAELFFYNTNGAVMQPQNDQWRKMRKLYISELLAPAQVEKQKNQRDESVMRLLKTLFASQQANETVDITAAVRKMNFYHITKLLFGPKAFVEGNSRARSLDDIISDLTNIDFLALGECFPYLRWLDIDRVECCCDFPSS